MPPIASDSQHRLQVPRPAQPAPASRNDLTLFHTEVGVAVTRARAAQSAWAALDPRFRLAPLRRLQVLLQTQVDAIAEVLRAQNVGETEALAWATGLVDGCRATVSGARNGLHPIRERRGLRVTSVTVLDPVGVVALVPGAPGFDLITTVTLLLAGNALVLLPEGPDRGGAVLLARLLTAARLPKDLVQVVAGPIGTADAAIGLVDLLLLDGADDRSLDLHRQAEAADIRVILGAPAGVSSFTNPRRLIRA